MSGITHDEDAMLGVVCICEDQPHEVVDVLAIRFSDYRLQVVFAASDS